MQLDLNLLTALDALLEEGSVAGAAARLHVTAPAMSRSLGRIRKATGDQILVRTGRSMVPTTRALAMRAQVHALVQQAHQLLSAQQELDLAALDQVFTVRWRRPDRCLRHRRPPPGPRRPAAPVGRTRDGRRRAAPG